MAGERESESGRRRPGESAMTEKEGEIVGEKGWLGRRYRDMRSTFYD